MIFEQLVDNGEIFLKQKMVDIFHGEEYKDQIQDILDGEDEVSLLEVDLDELLKEDQKLHHMIINQPTKSIKIMEEIIDEIIKETNQEDEIDNFEYRISFKGNLGSHTITPRGIRANMVNKLVKIEGIVTYTSKRRVRLLKSIHFCEKSKKFTMKQYNDEMSLKKQILTHSRNFIPLYDDQTNPLTFEYGISEFKDFQILGVQEMPENVPKGLLSRKVDILLQQELVDSAKPGDRVQIIGIVKPIVTSQTYRGSVFQKIVLAYQVKVVPKNGHQVFLTPKNIQEIKQVAKKTDLIDLFVRSFAPCIYGNYMVKEALLLMILGGQEVILENGGKIRGDMNVLLIGDPSTGKSQFLRTIMNFCPLTYSTTGRGSSGVGLTAAINYDPDSKEKRLEAGAMVLADRGIVCIDEFDKMTSEDRVAMHEVMEQQTVTIAKAGIHVSLNARCSILAAANPVYGEYVLNKSPCFNIGMRETLLSRFDLIFIMIDQNDPELDRKTCERVSLNHMLGTGKDNSSKISVKGVIEPSMSSTSIKKNQSPYFQNKKLFGDQKVKYLTTDFMQKYILYAKNLQPQLTEESSEYLAVQWSQIRKISQTKKKLTQIQILTIRTLESLIRMATAYAKLRLSDMVTIRDCVCALNMFTYSYYGGYQNLDQGFFKNQKNLLKLGRKKEKIQKKKEKKSKMTSSKKKSKNKKKSKRKLQSKKKTIYKLIYQYQNQEEEIKLNLDILWEIVQEKCPSSEFDVSFKEKNEFTQALTDLEEEGKILIDKDIIYII